MQLADEQALELEVLKASVVKLKQVLSTTQHNATRTAGASAAAASIWRNKIASMQEKLDSELQEKSRKCASSIAQKILDLGEERASHQAKLTEAWEGHLVLAHLIIRAVSKACVHTVLCYC